MILKRLAAAVLANFKSGILKKLLPLVQPGQITAKIEVNKFRTVTDYELSRRNNDPNQNIIAKLTKIKN